MDKKTRRPKGATIIDVAERAGVSPMTVSRVINGGNSVREVTKIAVETAIRDLNYTPNLAARKLVTSSEVRIGVVYSNPSAAFMSEFLVGIFEEASAKGAHLCLAHGRDGKAPQPDAIDTMIAAGLTGVVLAPPLGEAAAIRRQIKAASLPMAVVGGRTSGDAICVRIDDRKAAYDMTRHLLAIGHRRIGFILGNPDQSASADRLGGFYDAVREVEGVETTVVQGDFSYASGLAAGEQLLDASTPPTAIFASSDDMAAAVVSVAHRRHLDVPQDLSVVGFDDTTAGVTLWPPLTTVHQPVRDMAAMALDLLMQDLRSNPSELVAPREHILEHGIVERLSAMAPKSAKRPIRPSK